MTLVLGSANPRELGNGSTVPTFPQSPATWVDPTGAITIPSGALDRWFAYRQTLGAVHRSVVCFGDSTWYGSGGNYSVLQRLRDNATGASSGGPTGFGMVDGGKGMFGGLESFIVYDAPEVNGFVSTNFDFNIDSFDNLVGGYISDDGIPPGHTYVMQFRSTAARLWFRSATPEGQFTYSVDGGAPVTVSAHGSGTSRNPVFVYLSGFTPNVTHTITISNLGGTPLLAPPSFTVGTDHTAGSLPSNTAFSYVFTYVTTAGETTASPVSSVTTDTIGTTHQNLAFVTNPGGSVTAFRLYRLVTGTYLQVGPDITPSGGSFTELIDDGSHTPAGASPPVSNTAGLDGFGVASIAFDPVNATGVTFEKFSVSGATFGEYFFGGLGTPPFTQAQNGFRYQTALGLTPTTVGPPYTGAPVDTNYAAGARMSPVLCMANLGFNDLTNPGGLTQAQLNAEAAEYVKKVAGACQDASCDGIIVSGQLPFNANWVSLGSGLFNTLKSTALSLGLGFVDLLYPVAGPSLSYSGGPTNPHLTKTQYQAQADFLWNSLLGLL